MNDVGMDLNGVLNRLGSLRERSKTRNSNQAAQVARTVALPETVVKPEAVIEQEIISEVSAEREVDKENISKAKVFAETVIPTTPLKLKTSTEFTPEKMYEQVHKDYTGFIYQSINACLDALAVFYIQGNRFADSKDLKVFLMKHMQDNISSLREQYIKKYPLINGLESVIVSVEKNEANAFRNIVFDFIGKMNASTFG